LQFLVGASGICSYFTFTGTRFIYFKRNHTNPKFLDLLVSGLFAGIGMVYYGLGVYSWMSMMQNGTLNYAIPFFILGLFIFIVAFSDIMFLRERNTGEPYYWLFQHLTRMLGSYTTVLTSFCLVNFDKNPTIFNWIIPLFLGLLGIIFTFRWYKKRMNNADSASKYLDYV